MVYSHLVYRAWYIFSCFSSSLNYCIRTRFHHTGSRWNMEDIKAFNPANQCCFLWIIQALGGDRALHTKLPTLETRLKPGYRNIKLTRQWCNFRFFFWALAAWIHFPVAEYELSIMKGRKIELNSFKCYVDVWDYVGLRWPNTRSGVGTPQAC